MAFSRRQFLVGLGAGAGMALVPQWAFGAASEVSVIGGPAFGTYWRAVLPAGVDEALVRSAVEAVIERIDVSMSPYRADSEISAFNRLDSTDWFEASADFCKVADAALSVAANTEGAFEPSIGPLVNRFGFGPIIGEGGRFTDFATGTDAVRKMKGALTLDLCGIAKGYALDEIVAALTQAGFNDLFVELGGEVMAHGQHPAGRSWQVGIENPLPGQTGLEHVIGFDGFAMATSGTKAQGLDTDAGQFGHIIDARTGRPADTLLASVTVLAPSAMQADAYATALMVMGADKGAELAERGGLPVLFLLRDGDGLRAVEAGGFSAHILA